MAHHATDRQLQRIQESLQSAAPVDEPRKRTGPKEKAVGLTPDDEAWMRRWQLPRAQRLQSVESG